MGKRSKSHMLYVSCMENISIKTTKRHKSRYSDIIESKAKKPRSDLVCVIQP